MSQVISVLAKLKADTNSYVSGMRSADKATKDFKKGTEQVADSTIQQHSKMGQSAIRMGTIVKTAVMGFLTIQGAQFLKGAIKAASSFQAEFEGVNQSFGAGAKVVQDYAKTAAQTAGLTEISALRFSKTFGVMGKSAGLAGDDLGKFAIDMVQAAGDLGSFYDLPTEAALGAISAGLRGQYEPLRRFSILINEADVANKAMAMGLGASTKEISAQDKVLARQALILEGMGPAAGDFVKYATDYSNATKTLGAMFEDMKSRVGQALLPALSQVAIALMPLIERLGPLLTPVITALVPAVQALGNVIGLLDPIIKPITDLLVIVAGVFTSLLSSILPPLITILTSLANVFVAVAKPIGDAINGVMPVVNQLLTSMAGIITDLFKAFQPLIDLLPSFFNIITSLFPAILAIVDGLKPIVPLIGELIKMIAGAIQPLLPMFAELAGMVVILVQALMPLIPPLIKIALKLLPPILHLFKSLMPIIMIIAKLLISLLVPAIDLVFKILSPVLDFLATVIGGVVDAIAGFIDWLWPYIEPVLNAIIDGVNHVLSFFGMATIPKLPKKAVDDAFNSGKELGKSYKKGIDAGTTGAGGGTTQTTPLTTPQNTGEAPKNPVADFYKKMADDAKQQAAKLKLITMGLNEDLAQMVVSAGDGWEEIYKKIVKGGSAAIKELGNKFAQTAAGMQRVSDVVKQTMSNIQDSIMGAFDVSKLGQTSTQIMGNARRLVERAKAFGMEIKELSAKHLNPTLLNQVIAAGPVEGLALARSLNASDIGELNSLYNQMGQTATDVGKGVVGNQTQYIINVSGGIGDKNTIGKSIVEAIKSYERTSGISWRS